MSTPKLDDVEFAENPEPRCPCVLLLDTSGSMAGAPITALNDGLRIFQETLAQDSLAARRVEIAILTFDSSVNLAQDFITVDQFKPPSLSSGGSTAMGAGIEKALELVADRKNTYRTNGIAYYRPWIFMITDGGPTDAWQAAADRIKTEESKKRVAFFAVGVEGADMNRLQQISVRAPVKLQGLNFADLFVWLSSSMQKISQSKVSDQVALPPAGWASV